MRMRMLTTKKISVCATVAGLMFAVPCFPGKIIKIERLALRCERPSWFQDQFESRPGMSAGECLPLRLPLKTPCLLVHLKLRWPHVKAKLSISTISRKK